MVSQSRTWKNKSQVYTPLFKIVYRFTDRDEDPKVGFIVSGKVGKAVKRNRVRRLFSEAVVSWLAKLPSGSEVLLIAAPSSKDVGFEDVRSSMTLGMSKIIASKRH